jgi:heptosyltransferase-2
LKKWTIEGFASLADRLAETMSARMIVLGASTDLERNSRIAALAKSPVSVANHNMDVLTFAGALAALDAIVTGDTAAMHLGLAVHTPTICIFGPTSPVEVETYSRGAKVITPAECAPCYKTQCDRSPSCMELIDVETVFKALCRVLKNKEAL